MGISKNTNPCSKNTNERNLYFIKSMYQKMVLNKAKKGENITRVTERLKAVEIQLWALGESGKKKTVSNG